MSDRFPILVVGLSQPNTEPGIQDDAPVEPVEDIPTDVPGVDQPSGDDWHLRRLPALTAVDTSMPECLVSETPAATVPCTRHRSNPCPV